MKIRTGGILKRLTIAVLSAGLLLPGLASGGENKADDQLLEAMFDRDSQVEASTRNAKPLIRVAENVTVVTSEEIRGMNAHTLAEVLKHVPGLQVDFSGEDFGSSALLYAQGSREIHLLVLVDEIPWNYLVGGNAETNTIPLEIIDRIEIIKGPASSTWGSALGGVINIITKRGGAQPLGGSLSGSWGEHDTYDARALATGTSGDWSYLAYTGKQHSDGLVSMREYDNLDFFGKLGWSGMANHTFTLSMGLSEPEIDYGDIVQAALLSQDKTKAFWLRGAADVKLNQSLTAHLSLFSFLHRYEQRNQEDGQYAPAGSLFKNQDFDEATWGGSGQLAWSGEAHTLVAGFDYRNGSLDYQAEAGDYLQSQGAPPNQALDGLSAKTLGLYVNDTAVFGKLTLIPGLRVDHSDQWGWFTSPSLGVTCQAGSETLLRASIARGFTSPPVGFVEGTGNFIDPNLELGPETVLSYQAGFETAALPGLWLKGSAYFHDLDKAIELRTSPLDPAKSQYFNAGHVRRTGYELEAKTGVWKGFSAEGGIASVRVRPEDPTPAIPDRDTYTYDLGFHYEKGRFRALLQGHKVWWDHLAGQKGKDKDWLWDLHASCLVYEGQNRDRLDLFLSGRNLFNGEQYSYENFPNPERWFEAGARWNF